MQSNFRVFKELAFFNFWIPVSEFWFLCFRVAEITMLEFGSVLRGKKDGGCTF